ncbi:MAG TPA: Cd(II)/Pb(II)-responsive transcriptional regulator [Limnobacter sp.]|uniref:Cd(II)/Pb(II)-responsive transcriptional regulator n=1 Tax=Limnobacter sp. TaxID=2003368 RepID=UPI002ED8EDAB
MKIGELAERVGVSVETIRFYEKENLLCRPERTTANYRSYSEHHLEDLAFVVFCRNMDMPLEDIRKLLVLKHSPQASCEPINDAIDQQLAAVERRLTQLRALKVELQRLRAKCSGSHTVGECAIVKTALATR